MSLQHHGGKGKRIVRERYELSARMMREGGRQRVKMMEIQVIVGMSTLRGLSRRQRRRRRISVLLVHTSVLCKIKCLLFVADDVYRSALRDMYVALSAKALETNELTLTCKGMSSVNWNCSGPDFQFVFGEDKVCCVHSVLAEFLSPKVSSVRKCHPLCSLYAFKDSELFNVFGSLVSSLRSGAALLPVWFLVKKVLPQMKIL